MTGKPMDPERLAYVRDLLYAGITIGPEIPSELLADRDYHAQRADDAEAEVMTATAGLVSNANAVREQHAARVDRLLGEIERLRARATVLASDVEGIQPSQVVGHMVAAGWVKDRLIITHEWKWYVMRRGASGLDVPTLVDAPDYPTVLARLFNDLATIEGRPGLDIVDAIRATEVSP